MNVSSKVGAFVAAATLLGPAAALAGAGGQSSWRMKSTSGMSYLRYWIYQEQSFAMPFLTEDSGYYVLPGGGVTASNVRPGPITGSSLISVILYGKLPALQGAPVGSYSDPVQVILEY